MGLIDIGHIQLAANWKSVLLKGVAPLLPVLDVFPGGFMLSNEKIGSLSEWHLSGNGKPRGFANLCACLQWITAAIAQVQRSARSFAGGGKAYCRITSQAHAPA